MSWFHVNLQNFDLLAGTVLWSKGFIDGCGLFDRIEIHSAYISFDDEANAVQFDLILQDCDKPKNTGQLHLGSAAWERAVDDNQTLFKHALRKFLKGPNQPTS